MKVKYLKFYHFFDSYIERPKIKKLNNVQLLKEFSFFDDLSIVKNKTAFSGYSRCYKVEIVDKRDVITQLKNSKIAIKDFFKDLLVELKGFKYQITLYVLLSKVKSSNLTEFSPVYFNSLSKNVIGNKYFLDQCFNEKMFRLKNWISRGSG